MNQGTKWLCAGLTFLFYLPVVAPAEQIPAPAEPAGQAPAAAQRWVGESDSSEGLIRLDVVVTDKAGKPVTGLEAGEFTLLDNGQPQKLVSFHAFDGTAARPDPPVELILMIDALNLSSQQVSHEEQEVMAFLHENEGHLALPVSIYRLSDTGLRASAQPSTDGNALADAVAHRSEPRIIWAVPAAGLQFSMQGYYATVHNLSSLSALGAIAVDGKRRPGRKLLIWIGFGWPLDGGENSLDWITEFSTRLREARITLSSVTSWAYQGREFKYQEFLGGVKSQRDANPADLALEVLATQSGGRVGEQSSDLKGQIDRCVENANAFYTLTFDPPRAEKPDEYHDLQVELGRPELTARTSTGYYDQPVYYDQPAALQRVTVAQLEQELAKAQSSTDADGARQLSGMELTERLSSTKLSRWRTALRGEKARQALESLAGASVFLALPAAEIPATAAPELNDQRLMLSHTMDYLGKTLPRLPNFFATRTTVRYEEPRQKDDQTWKTVVGDQTLHASDTSKATVLYRNGQEVSDREIGKGKKTKARERTLVTEGTFGPILATVFVGATAAHSKLQWSGWEQGANGPVAVFRYVVPSGTTLFKVDYCCIADVDGTTEFHKQTGFHGEIAIDPESGAILRLTVEADLEPRLPLSRSAIMVEYGPVDIGGKTYICPMRSVTLSRGRTARMLHQWNVSLGVYGPFETMLNDVTFGDYHMFRAQARILTDYEPAPGDKPVDSGLPGAAGAAPKPKP